MVKSVVRQCMSPGRRDHLGVPGVDLFSLLSLSSKGSCHMAFAGMHMIIGQQIDLSAGH